MTPFLLSCIVLLSLFQFLIMNGKHGGNTAITHCTEVTQFQGGGEADNDQWWAIRKKNEAIHQGQSLAARRELVFASYCRGNTDWRRRIARRRKRGKRLDTVPGHGECG